MLHFFFIWRLPWCGQTGLDNSQIDNLALYRSKIRRSFWSCFFFSGTLFWLWGSLGQGLGFGLGLDKFRVCPNPTDYKSNWSWSNYTTLMDTFSCCPPRSSCRGRCTHAPPWPGKERTRLSEPSPSPAWSASQGCHRCGGNRQDPPLGRRRDQSCSSWCHLGSSRGQQSLWRQLYPPYYLVACQCLSSEMTLCC